MMKEGKRELIERGDEEIRSLIRRGKCVIREISGNSSQKGE